MEQVKTNPDIYNHILNGNLIPRALPSIIPKPVVIESEKPMQVESKSVKRTSKSKSKTTVNDDK